ncbi:globin domain-containing protein [Streptomyces sp. NPDC005492]|uniref:globin domain-containing protein n=1 Tax=Streptomyces sp. NPDC005492 TaxID=3156883 RepID=UPI0033BF8640
MLTAQSATVVRATLPAVGAAIEDIAGRFYERLFAAHPELLRDLFNRGNQAVGAQRQALAGSIAAFAAYLVDHPDDRPDVMLHRIAHKHASLGVRADQYPIVHEHLFAAIAEVLGEAVTPEVAHAWDEVYWLMANALVAIEDRLYAQQDVVDANVWREWEVIARTDATPDVAAFVLRPADGRPVPAFRAGQYVSVQVQLADGARQIRQYSLTGAPSATTRSIAVKRMRGAAGTPDGEVSRHLHAHVHEGDRLRVSAPYGDLVLAADEAPLLLVSAGIGCTPMLAMLEQLATTGHAGPVTVVHADHSPASHALRTDHRTLTAELPDATAQFWYEHPDDEDAGDGHRTGLVDLTDVAIAPGTRSYLCGPLPFMRAVRGQLLDRGVAAADIHYEVFGPDLWLATT